VKATRYNGLQTGDFDQIFFCFSPGPRVTFGKVFLTYLSGDSGNPIAGLNSPTSVIAFAPVSPAKQYE
jgi:hypothetical protein